jgi:hypothetical protein
MSRCRITKIVFFVTALIMAMGGAAVVFLIKKANGDPDKIEDRCRRSIHDIESHLSSAG